MTTVTPRATFAKTKKTFVVSQVKNGTQVNLQPSHL